MARSSYMMTPEDMKERRMYARRLMLRGSEPQKIEHWTQGLAHMAQSALGGYELHKLDKEDKAQRDDAADINRQLILGQSGRTAPGNIPRNAEMTPAFSPAAAGFEPGQVVPGTPSSLDNAAWPHGPIGAPGSKPVMALASADPGAPVNIPRAAVPSTGRVWGDKEAEDAGLYERSAPQPARPQVMAQAPLPVTTPNGVSGLNPQLVDRMSRNPRTQALVQALAMKQFGENKPTDAIKEFEYAGRNPAFKNYKIDLKRAGAIQNQVTIDQKGEGEFSKTAGGLQAKRFDELASDGLKATQMLSDLDTLRVLGSQIGTGKGAQVMAALGPYTKSR